ncbi:hypothetical protein [Halolamina pelagica]|uniref:hypothetical protein n=1 Tax=Halolamina pelagica TaxID=699431 RepID=UPI0006CA9FAC|nr:hypothetical protein [Halolamina pelagica]
MLPRRWPHDRGRFPQSNAAAQSFLKADVGPENTGNQNRTYYEVSHVQFYYCENGDDDNSDGDNGNGGNGDDNHHDNCWPNSTTLYIGFSWEFPFEVGNEIQTDEVRFDLQFHAQQCRHNDDPPNPYAE